jgi:hypothetical protein
MRDSAEIQEVIEVQVSVLRSVARRRLVETENPSACATVKCKVFKSAIALYGLYCLYVSVIKRACVTKLLINSIIRTRNHHSFTRTPYM